MINDWYVTMLVLSWVIGFVGCVYWTLYDGTIDRYTRKNVFWSFMFAMVPAANILMVVFVLAFITEAKFVKWYANNTFTEWFNSEPDFIKRRKK